MQIILSTLNARYAHCALGLRYLYANLESLQSQAKIMEFVIGVDLNSVAEKILAFHPKIIGLSVYIWNVQATAQLIRLLKTIEPQLTIIVGGPEVSFSKDHFVNQVADYVISGCGEITFYQLCQSILSNKKPAQKFHVGIQADLSKIKLPYDYYTQEDIQHRTLYVEASRGCPFKCEFCLSSIDKSVSTFPLDTFLAELEKLYQRGAREFKFIDRTFNLDPRRSTKILQFFLDKIQASKNELVFAHFEMVPDRLHDDVRKLLVQFPKGTLQLELGVQSFNPSVQALISRKQNNELTQQNLLWLKTNTHAHLHTDLIIGLPDENIQSFAQGFNRLVRLQPDEIQIGFLKRLNGTPILRHQQAYDLRFESEAPYTILSTKDISFKKMQSLKRFARFWDLIANSGRFLHTLPIILGNDPFQRFMALSHWLYAQTNATHLIALDRLASLVTRWLTQNGLSQDQARILIGKDFIPRQFKRQSSESNKNSLERQKRRING